MDELFQFIEAEQVISLLIGSSLLLVVIMGCFVVCYQLYLPSNLSDDEIEEELIPKVDHPKRNVTPPLVVSPPQSPSSPSSSPPPPEKFLTKKGKREFPPARPLKRRESLVTRRKREWESRSRSTDLGSPVRKKKKLK